VATLSPQHHVERRPILGAEAVHHPCVADLSRLLERPHLVLVLREVGKAGIGASEVAARLDQHIRRDDTRLRPELDLDAAPRAARVSQLLALFVDAAKLSVLALPDVEGPPPARPKVVNEARDGRPTTRDELALSEPILRLLNADGAPTE